MTFPIENDTFNWKYTSEPEPRLNSRRIGQARGRCLGGSSAINGMLFVRGNPRDYDSWTRFGLEEWTFEDCLPYFKRLECFAGSTDPNRGTGGPLSVQKCKADHVFHDRFLEAAAQFGLKRTPDHNSTVQEGSHVTQATIRDGIRISTAEAYLDPVKSRINLAIRTNCFVNRLVFEGNAAVGVEYSTRGSTRVIRAAKEVVVCTGTIGSPQILMLSGIGDAEHLKEHDIDVVQHVPGVGGNLQDHVVAPLRYRCDKPMSVKRHLDLFGRIRLGAEWRLFRKGLGASNFFEVGAYFNSGDAPGGYPHLQHEFLPILADFQDGKVALTYGFQYFVSQMRPYSRGRIRLKSADPRKHPAIHFNNLDDSRDLAEMLNGIRMTREMALQPAWDGFRHAELDQNLKDFSDEELTCRLRAHANTEHHPVGTCRMGDDDNAVTDGSERVHGVDRLRTGCASWMVRSCRWFRPRTSTADYHGRGKGLRLDLGQATVAASAIEMVRKIAARREEIDDGNERVGFQALSAGTKKKCVFSNRKDESARRVQRRVSPAQWR